MKKALALAAILAWVTSANAVVQIFFTNSADGYGLTAGSAFQPTANNGTDGADYAASFPPAGAWGVTPTIDYSAGEFAYVWLRFSGEANNRKIQGLHMDMDGTPAEVAYYIMDDLNGDTGAKRWDGAYTGPNEPEFKMDPQILAAVGAAGIVNRSTAADNWNLYDNATRTALLGAVRYDSDGLRSAALGSLGIKYANILTPPTVEFGSADWVPEPASLALLGLAGLLIRRR
jgi:hypothetical protein